MGGWASGWCAGSSWFQASGGGDGTRPSVYDFSPAPGTPITPSTAITFKVADETALRSVMVWAKYPDGRSELIYDGDSFEPEFATYSTVTAGTFGSLVGFSFSIRRYHGWQAAPEIRTRATDRGGNEAA
jgi:hypothetical protein